VLPLSIAGTADAVSYDQGYRMPVPAAAPKMESMAMADMVYATEERQRTSQSVLTGGTVQTAEGSSAGGQFEFTSKNPVKLDRRMSAMFPLVESQINASKLLIYSGSGRHPRLGAELTNNTSMKLPAGPITVYDGGVYAGDALIEFWNENEKRLISFGEDLSVTGSSTDTTTLEVSTVNVSGGVMTITRNRTYIKTYTFLNTGSASKDLIVEHTKTSQSELVSPKADEQTDSAYRFKLALPANRETTLAVSERRPVSERITLLGLRTDAFLSYSTNQEIPARIRTALTRAVELRRAVDAADANVRELETQKARLISDQDRIRRNLEAAGNQTQQGQEYLRRLVALDGEIDATTSNLDKAIADAKAAQQAYENYLNTLNF
jgi:hypothetical protein